MRKRKKGRKLHRKRDQRRALLKGLCRNLLLYEKIQTTEAKAKELSSLVEKLITKAKQDNLSTRRYLGRYFSKDIVRKLVEELGERYKERPGGYTRIIKLGPRRSDGAKMAIIELIKS